MGLPQAGVSIPDYLDRKTQAPSIEDATLFTGRGLSLGEPVTKERLYYPVTQQAIEGGFRGRPLVAASGQWR